MADEIIPCERAIRELTSAALSAASALNHSMDALIASGGYYEITEPMKPYIKTLSNPEISEGMKTDGARQKLFQLVSDLLDAHLDLYEAATRKINEGKNVRAISDFIRKPALLTIQCGYSCLAFLEFSEPTSNMAELERLARKGEVNAASASTYVCQSIDLLKAVLEDRKRPIPKAPPQKTRQTGRKVKAR